MIICFQLNVYQPWPLARYYVLSGAQLQVLYPDAVAGNGVRK